MFAPNCTLRSGRRRALRRHVHRVERLARGHEEPVALRTTERDVAADFGKTDPAEQLAVGIPHGDAAVAETATARVAVARHPEVPVDVAARSVGTALDSVDHEVGEALAVRQL